MGARFGQFMRSETFRSFVVSGQATCPACGARLVTDDDSGDDYCPECARDEARQIAEAVDVAVWDAALDAQLHAAHDAMLAARVRWRRARSHEMKAHWWQEEERQKETWLRLCERRRQFRAA